MGPHRADEVADALQPVHVAVAHLEADRFLDAQQYLNLLKGIPAEHILRRHLGSQHDVVALEHRVEDAGEQVGGLLVGHASAPCSVPGGVQVVSASSGQIGRGSRFQAKLPSTGLVRPGVSTS